MSSTTGARWRTSIHAAKIQEKWTGLPQRPVDVTAETVVRLEGAIREYYQRLDGRGEACQVEYRRRSAPWTLFAYPADYVDDVEEYEDQLVSSAGTAGSRLFRAKYRGAARLRYAPRAGGRSGATCVICSSGPC